MNNYKELLGKITTLIFDYDGVLTTGSVLITEKGEQLRTGHVRDGYALQLAVKKGLRVAVISGGKSEGIIHRCRVLGIEDVFTAVRNKEEKFRSYINANRLRMDEVLYMGDDIPDYPLMKLAGLPVCPADACEEIKSISLYISLFGGGKGCVRDITEQLLKVQGKWMDEDAYVW